MTMYSLQSMLGRIKGRKKSLKMTNRELSQKANIPIGTLSKILAGSETKDPQISSIIKIATALEVSCDFLIYGVEDTAPALTQQEQTLLAFFNAFNPEGQERLLETADDMTKSGKYKKCDQLEMVGKEA